MTTGRSLTQHFWRAIPAATLALAVVACLVTLRGGPAASDATALPAAAVGQPSVSGVVATRPTAPAPATLRVARRQPNHSGYRWLPRRHQLVLSGTGRPTAALRAAMSVLRATGVGTRWVSVRDTRKQLWHNRQVALADPRVRLAEIQPLGRYLLVGVPATSRLADLTTAQVKRRLGLTVTIRVGVTGAEPGA